MRLLPAIILLILIPVASAQPCNTAADADCNGQVSITEVTGFINLWYSCSACAPNLLGAITAYYSTACSSDPGCLSPGSFCDGPSLPYSCALNATDGCLDRSDAMACGSGYFCIGGACIEDSGGCEALGNVFVEDFESDPCIDANNVVDVGISGGSVVPSGTTTGELAQDPTMEILYHFNSDPAHREDGGLVYDFAHQRHPGFRYTSSMLPRIDGKFNGSYYLRTPGYGNELNFIGKGLNNDNVTFSFWVASNRSFPLNSSGSARLLGGADALILSLTGDDIDLRIGSVHAYARDLPWKADEWHHVAVVLQRGRHQLYIDGNLTATNAYGGSPNVSTWYLYWHSNTIRDADISIDEFAAYNRALAPAEIAALARGERLRTGSLESGWIGMNGEFDSIKASLEGTSTESANVLFSCDGMNWEDLAHGQWESYTHNGQLPCSQFKYRVAFSNDYDARLDRISFEWKNSEERENEFVFVAYGDSRANEVSHNSVAREIEKVDPALVLHGGDMVTSGGSNGDYLDWRVFDTIVEKLRGRRTLGLNATFFGTLGNHEKSNPYHGYFDSFGYWPHYGAVPADPSIPDCTGAYISNCNLIDPDNPGKFYIPYYNFTYKNSCFISLYYYDYEYDVISGIDPDRNIWTHEPINVTDVSGTSGPNRQYRWLYNSLKDCSSNPDVRWKFVMFHYPPFSSGSHGIGDGVADRGYNHYAQFSRQHVSSLLEYFNVTIVFNGHDHDYERTYPLKLTYDPAGNNGTGRFDGAYDPSGVTYIVTGAGGMLDSSPKSNFPAWSAFFNNTKYHFVKLDVTDDSIHAETIDSSGNVFDSFVINYSNPERADLYIDNRLSSDCIGTYSILNRSCSGSDGIAYRTFSGASQASQPGNIILIREGVFSERLVPRSGSPGLPVTYKGYGNENVVITGPTLYPAIDLSYKSNIIVDGMNVTYVRVYVDASGARNTTIRNSHFTNYAQSGSFGMIRYFDGARNNRFIDNTVSGIVPFADENDLLIIRNSTNNLIEGNFFDTGTHVILAIRCGSYNVIRDNYFTNDKNKIMEIYDCCEDALNNSIPTERNVVEGNIFAKATGDGDSSPEAGIQFAGQRTILRRNVFYENLGGISFSLYPGSNCNIAGHYEAYRNYENRAYNNVFYSNHHGGVLTGSATGAEVQFYNNTIKNSIFLDNDLQLEPGTEWKPSWWINYLAGKPIQFNPGRLDGFVFENNDVVTPSGNESWAIVAGGTSALVNPPTGAGIVSWWESNYPSLFRNNSVTNPSFVNENTHDFRLQPGSQMINAGEFLTKTTNAGPGTTMQVLDAKYFYDGYGMEGEQGDMIQLQNGGTARIVGIDYSANALTLDRSLIWNGGQGVSLAYSGSAPDIGAYESG